MGGLTFDKILIILVIAMFVVGPTRLPMYAKKLGDFVRSVKQMADGAKDRLKEEMGPEYDNVDWKQLDPRQYDPRRIVRDALMEDEREAKLAARRERLEEIAAARRAKQGIAKDGSPVTVRFDDEAT
ncbi:twin-arginine translocase TatA/TatE family subunit [Leucobacter denitrificans]|uniref:Twin-arginine translocase TatA/TatE family subunit n=1 Tax=Leucobacter denitrificans TaxID=683042 RepID=A0A7G9S4V6_9MICO|nr:twin-arginine translocase TatA/TatE family subunit [Leucobacter denitrificans]QNN62881.1 twin-arginine translocase TatA/TatE family subunit [Leucobacter denitrificans]